MAGDSVSLPTNVAHADTVSRIQQSQATDQQANDKLAKKTAENSDDESALLKTVAETERARLRKERRDERRRRRREQKRRLARRTGKSDTGNNVDLKV